MTYWEGQCSFRSFGRQSKIASITASYQHHYKVGESPSPSFSDSDRPDDDEDLYLHRQRLMAYRGPSPEYPYPRVYPTDLSKRLPASPPPRSSAVSSLFTIDSILAPRPNASTSTSQSLASASPHRLPTPAILRHPLHFGHLAAVASGFSPSSSDFLGKKILFCLQVAIKAIISRPIIRPLF